MKPARVLIVPGLHGSGPAHWQTWLQAHWRNAVRVQQDDWSDPDLLRWSRRIGEAAARDPDTPWIAVAHSFGCLALAHHLAQRPRRDEGGIAGALFVAPAAPARFGLGEVVPQRRLGVPATLLSSDTDPWMPAADAAAWAARWGARCINLGDVGHINVDAGFGPLPRALQITQSLIRRVERARRPQRAGILEFSFAV
ncbi:alpha/beta hydrolase [Piscinibacter sp. XHJ-5]|uniref:RBBP9/YdeN family alpha/beta hydrolase n=1 Tax=Piscinibacter sp. XHJ-5 TaxID=3037797 RepID=UPI0024534F68|nr:alpha/beta hydrolase [Piscinibacter sp. XHJ-5]